MAVELSLEPGTWADAEARVGTQLAVFTGADEVTRADIRRRLEVLAWDCPLHYDADAATRAGSASGWAWPGACGDSRSP